ncbi:hypothetical protein KVR01_009924 [Diaporthe batatas]|uniref:uncharacterized protein n=1 Tax=Diaporthe batatas TaxID=748121 RepID=UPI001D055496|nr:uncharacterized protein KVR01_009924 [Diaporthe batatas]KAG8160388.1 hypothetical protein KVR01_009924 [Diaporthe batatas]
MERQRGEARGAPGAARRPQKPSIGSKTASNASPDTDGHQSKPQNVHKDGQDGAGRPIAAQSSESPKGAAPGSAAPHASAALFSSNDNDAQPHPAANYQPHNGIRPNTSNGQQHSPAVSVTQQPPVAGPSASGTTDTQSEQKAAEARIGAARPMPAASTETCSRPPKPAADARAPASLTSSLPSLLTSAPAANSRLGSDLGRQHGSPGDAHGSAASISPVGQVSADGGRAPVSKPILKMRRTGQNFPIASPRSSSPLRTPASLHQKKAPSPNKTIGPVQQGSRGLSKDPETTQNGGSGVREAANGPDIDRKSGSGTPVRSSGPSTYTQFLGGLTAKPKSLDGQSKAVPKPAHSKTETTPTESLSIGNLTDHVADESSDDEIKYEATPKLVVSDDVSEDDLEDDTSEDETELDGEGDATLVSTASREADASSRQLFHPPDESDYGDEVGDDEGDEDDEGDSTVSASPSESSPAADEEPMVTVSSASIQRRQDYPGRILETAKSGRPYHTWLDGRSSFHNGGALFPDGYQKSTRFAGSSWICPVRSCRQVHKTAFSLGDHFKVKHKRFMFNDNMDGTLSVVGSYSKRSQPGKHLPVVVSRRPLDPREPPMAEAMEPTGRDRFPSDAIQAESDSESESLDPETLVTGDIEDPARPAGPSQVLRRGSAHEMWQYIRPFLTNHRDSSPTGNWIQDVVRLPRVRDIKWNEPRIKELPYMDTHLRDITALIIQVTGVEAPTPCAACAQGRGPFNGCVRISPQASQESRNSVLACANCYYHCNQSKCSHCAAAVPRRDRQRRERLRDKKTIYNVKVLSDRARGRARGAIRLEKPVKEPRASRTTVDNSPEETSHPRVKIYQPDEIHSLEMASKDRAYKMIRGEHGEPISMCGALIPDRYDLDRTVPGRPWVCPIRSCRAAFKKIVGLGSHFAVKHRGNLLNDNQDGTLSIVGAYNSPLKGSKYCAPLVISQKPLDESEPPMEAPKVPGYVRVGDTNSEPPPRPADRVALNPGRSADSAQLNRVEPPESDKHSGAKRVWNHILPFLPQPLDPKIFDPEIIRLFALPVLQRVQWRNSWMKRRLDNDRYQIFAILVHVLGVERNASGERCCSLCISGEGPFEGCWTLPRAAAWESHRYATCCANCLFAHKRSHCSVKSSWETRCITRPGEKTFTGTPPPVAEWAATATTANDSSQAKKRQLSPSGANEESLSQRRRYEQSTGSNDEEQPGAGRRIVTLPLPLSRRTTRATNARTRRHESPEPQPEQSKPLVSTSSSAVMMAGQQTSDELLEMEDWEIAPGRIREDGSAHPNNIAFSKAFLENSQSIPVAADVSFRVDTIKSGHKLEFEATTSNTRYCSVATGKLRVSIAGQPEFVIGPHGVFKIKPGVKAWAQNRLYIDSVVHVVSVRE